MNRAKFSVLKSALNSWHYNVIWRTLKMLSNLTFIKLNFKRDIRINKSTKVYLRNGTSDLPVFRQIFLDCEYDLNLPSSNIKTIIDGGCNVGLASVYFATTFPQSRVIGIEPDESNYQQALKN